MFYLFFKVWMPLSQTNRSARACARLPRHQEWKRSSTLLWESLGSDGSGRGCKRCLPSFGTDFGRLLLFSCPESALDLWPLAAFLPSRCSCCPSWLFCHYFQESSVFSILRFRNIAWQRISLVHSYNDKPNTSTNNSPAASNADIAKKREKNNALERKEAKRRSKNKREKLRRVRSGILFRF